MGDLATSPPTPRRRWRRFSIRGLMLLMLVIGALLAFVVKDLIEAREEQAIISKLSEVRVSITFVHDMGENPDQLPGNPFLRAILGENYKVRLYEARMTEPIGEETILRLPNLRHLEILELRNEKLSDRSVDALARIPRLRRLTFHWIEITPEQLRRLAQSDSIEMLSLDRRSSTDAHLAQLPLFPNLEEVSLWQLYNPVTGKQSVATTDNGIKSLANIKGLKSLAVSEAPNITDEAFVNIDRFRDLESLHISYTQVSDKSLAHIARLTSLRELVLRSDGETPRISSDGIKQLHPLKNLVEVELKGAGIDDRCIPTIAQLPNLEELYLSHTSVTDAGLSPLKDSPSLVRLIDSQNQITPKGLKAIGFIPDPDDPFSAGYVRQLPAKPSAL